MENTSSRKFWTLRYTLLNATYFVAFCAIHAFALNFLLAHGFTNTQVGILLAVANITSAFVQPWIAGIIDKRGWLTNRRFILISVLSIAAGALALLFVPEVRVFIFVVYALIYMIQFAYQPIMLAICFEYQRAGCRINFGLSRGLGSASFAVTAFFIGSAVERNGVSVLLIVSVIALLISAVVIYTFRKPETGENGGTQTGDAQEEAAKGHSNLLDFARTYPVFMLFLAATVCLFFAHNMINDFMIQIIRSLGGTETHHGYASFMQAILELPVMALIGYVYKKISANKLLIVSGTAFLIKILVLVFSVHLAGMFISQSFQLFAYAVFVPASAFYVTTTMDEYDQVKGQAFVTSAITIGGVFSNLISGVIMDMLGVKSMLIAGSIVCALGTLIIWIAMLGRRSNRSA